MIVVYFCCGALRVQVYRIAGKLRESLINTPGKMFRDFYFRHKSRCLTTHPTISRMEMVTSACISKRVSRCRRKLPCQGEGANTYWMCGSKKTVLDSLSARNFWRQKFSQKQIFASWCLIARKSRKFPAIRYEIAILDALPHNLVE